MAGNLSAQELVKRIGTLRHRDIIRAKSFKEYTDGLIAMQMDRLRNMRGGFYEVMLAKAIFVLRKRGLLEEKKVPGAEFSRLLRAINRCPPYVDPQPTVQVEVTEEVPPVEAPF